MTDYLLLFVGTVLVNNFVLVKFLGLCPFMGVSKKLETAMGMGLATTFVMTLASICAWWIDTWILIPLGLTYLRTLAFILVIAVVVQFTEMVVRKTSPALYRLLGIFLPLITTNCAVLGVALLNINLGHNLCNRRCTVFPPPSVSRWLWCCLPLFASAWWQRISLRRFAVMRLRW
jgi:electron transport complex protein RnfA